MGRLGLLGLELDVGVAARRCKRDGGCSVGTPWAAGPVARYPTKPPHSGEIVRFRQAGEAQNVTPFPGSGARAGKERRAGRPSSRPS